MNLYPLFIIQFFAVVVYSKGNAAPSPSLVPPSVNPTSTALTSTNGTSATITGTATGNATSLSATPTATASFPTLSNVSSCVSGCLAQGSARLNCTSLVDVNCFCVNPQYPAEIVDCVLANCSDQVSVIEGLGQQFCNVASVHPTLSFPPVPTTTTLGSTSTKPSTVTTPTASATTSTIPTSNAASFWTSTSGPTTLIGLGVLLVLCVMFGV